MNKGEILWLEVQNLRWDTRSNNTKDAIEHGVHPCIVYVGEKHYRSKLTRDDVEGIIELYDTGLYTQQELAILYGVGQDVISRIINKKA